MHTTNKEIVPFGVTATMQISPEKRLTFIVNFEHSSKMDLSHTCPRRGLDQGSGAIFKIYPLVFPRRKNTRGWPLPSWSTSRTSTTTADTWLVEFFQPAKLARVWRTPGRSKCSVSKRAWSPLYRKNQPLARKPTREQYFPQMRLKSRCVWAPPQIRITCAQVRDLFSFQLFESAFIRFYHSLLQPKSRNQKTRKHVPRK